MSFCRFCGANIKEGGAFCDGCGKPVGASASPYTVSETDAEKKFYETENILVTNSRFVVDARTYAMSGITSVSRSIELPSRKGPIITVVIGAIITLPGFDKGNIGLIVLGLIIIAVGIFWLKQKKSMYYVSLRTASGESRAYGNVNQDHIDQLVKALNDAIVFRR